MVKTKSAEEIKYNKIKRKKNTSFVFFLVVLLVLITIGYASLATVLNINGNTTIGKFEWNIHFQNIQTLSADCDVVHAAEITNAEQTLVEYTIGLDELTDDYEFTVDVVNTGSLTGVLESATLGGLSTEASRYLDYTVTYADDTAITSGSTLAPGQTKTLKVRVAFKDDLTNDDLPTSEETFHLTYQMKYVQQ